MARPRYATRHNLKPVFKGDSLILPEYSFRFGNSGVTLEDAKIQFTDRRNRIVADIQLQVTGSKVVMAIVDTSFFTAGTLDYELTLTLSNGLKRTYIFGKLVVKDNNSKHSC